jgi:hypothetical protein
VSKRAGFLVVSAPTLCAAVAFGYTGGWFSPRRLGPQRMIAALEAIGGVHPGFRRNHAKGLCVTGFFDSNGEEWRTGMNAIPVFPLLGIAIFVLVLIRLVNRWLHPGPPLPAHLTAPERFAAKASQVVLYALLRRAHTVLADAFFATFLAHFWAALVHALIYRDGVFTSMVPWKVRPRDPSSGA